MPKEFDLNMQKQIVRVQVSELQHLPEGRQVFSSLGSVMLPADKDELLDEVLAKGHRLEAQASELAAAAARKKK